MVAIIGSNKKLEMIHLLIPPIFNTIDLFRTCHFSLFGKSEKSRSSFWLHVKDSIDITSLFLSLSSLMKNFVCLSGYTFEHGPPELFIRLIWNLNSSWNAGHHTWNVQGPWGLEEGQGLGWGGKQTKLQYLPKTPIISEFDSTPDQLILKLFIRF